MKPLSNGYAASTQPIRLPRVWNLNTRYAVIATVLYKIVLDFVYFNYIYKLYSYQGIQLHLSSVKLIESYLIIIIITALLSRTHIKPSSMSLRTLYIFFIIPFLSIYSMMYAPRTYTYFVICSFMLTFYITKSAKYFNIKPIRGGEKFLVPVGTIIVVYALLVTSALNALPTLESLNPANVYKTRSMLQGGWFLETMRSWASFVIIPFFTAHFYLKRKYVFLLIPVFYSTYTAAITGGKYTFFILLMTILLCYAYQKKKIMVVLCLTLLCFIIFSVFIYTLTDNKIGIHLLVYRPLFIPAWLSNVYYEFFSTHPKLFFSEIFPWLIQSPYNIASPLIVGEYLFGVEAQTWANNGMFAQGYANLGFMGLILYCILYGIILKVADSIYEQSGQGVVIIVVSIMAQHLIQASLLTVLASRGFLFLLLFCWLAIKSNGKSAKQLYTVS